jgi:hypothetical protein
VSDRGFSQVAEPSSTSIQVSVSGLTLAAWSGQGGAQPDIGASSPDAFQSIAAPNEVASARFDFGPWAVTGEGGAGERTEPFASAPVKAASYGRVGAEYVGAGYSARLSVGVLDEPLGPLGSNMIGTYALPSTTQFLTVGGERRLPGNAVLYGEGSVGRSRFSGAFMETDNALSSSWRVGIVAPCGLGWLTCSHFGLELAQPLRFESGDLTADLANVPAHYFDPVTFSQRRIGVAPSGREMDLRVFVDRDLHTLGFLRLEATAASDEGQRASAVPGLGLLASWRYGF